MAAQDGSATDLVHSWRRSDSMKVWALVISAAVGLGGIAAQPVPSPAGPAPVDLARDNNGVPLKLRLEFLPGTQQQDAYSPPRYALSREVVLEGETCWRRLLELHDMVLSETEVVVNPAGDGVQMVPPSWLAPRSSALEFDAARQLAVVAMTMSYKGNSYVTVRLVPLAADGPRPDGWKQWEQSRGSISTVDNPAELDENSAMLVRPVWIDPDRIRIELHVTDEEEPAATLMFYVKNGILGRIHPPGDRDQ